MARGRSVLDDQARAQDDRDARVGISCATTRYGQSSPTCR
jgi:hypothetical protein